MTPRTVDGQAPLFMEFSSQEYWSGWPFPTPGICLQSKESATTTHSPRLRLRAHLGVGMRSGGKEGKRVLLRVCNVGKHEAGLQEEGLPR